MTEQTHAAVQAQPKASAAAPAHSNLLQRVAISPAITPVHSPILQRCTATEECAECRERGLATMQRAALSAAPVNAVPPIVHEVLNSPGQPLDAGARAFMEPRFGQDFSGVRVHAALPPLIQAKLTLGQPGDTYEQEADQTAETIMRAPVFGMADGVGDQTGKANTIQAKAVPNHLPEAYSGGSEYLPNMRGGGQPLPLSTRNFFEPRFGYDFSQVRVHTDSSAARMAGALHAQAFTIGRDIVFGAGRYEPGASEGKKLLAHELTHVVQQGNATSNHIRHTPVAPRIQRRLVTFGTLADVNALLGLLGPSAGLTLTLDIATNQVQIAAVLPGAPPSPALRAQLTRIINHATQHAEAVIGRGQPGVLLGAFPQPSDLTVTRVQQIDIDDALAAEAGVPGNGVATVAHELEENFQAHGVPAVAGRDRFARAHEQALNLESAVASELIAPGHFFAQAIVPTGPGTLTVVRDFENYYIVWNVTANPATRSQDITGSRRAPRVAVSARTIDGFAFNSSVVPGPGAPTIAAAVADAVANPTATILIEGFADSVGSAAASRTVSLHRAERIRDRIVAAGVDQNRIHIEGRGAVNFVAPNVTDADRAQNRRTVITVTRPGP